MLTLFVLHFNGFSSSDFWIQAAVGDYIRSHLSLPKTALYTYTESRDLPFLVHEWFSSVIMSIIAKVDGESGIKFAITKLLISGLMFILLYTICRRKNLERVLSLAFASIISIFISFRVILRAENLAFILFLIFIYLFQIHLDTRKKYIAFLLFIVTVLWANCHGSFVLIFVYLTLYFVSMIVDGFYEKNNNFKEVFKFLLFIVLMLSATFINPYGYEIWVRAFSITTDAYMKNLIAEWQPTFSEGFTQTPSFYFYLIFSITSLALILKNIKKLKIAEILIFSVFFLLSFFALRHVAYLYLASAGILAGSIALMSEKIKRIILFGFTTLILANITYVFGYGNYNQINISTKFDAPLELETIDWLREKNVAGPVFNSYGLGDQLIYNFYPKILVAIDSRTDLYGENYSTKYLYTLYDTKRFLDFIEFFKIKVIILAIEDFDNYFIKNNDRMVYLDKAGWRVGHKSEYNIILVKFN